MLSDLGVLDIWRLELGRKSFYYVLKAGRWGGGGRESSRAFTEVQTQQSGTENQAVV